MAAPGEPTHTRRAPRRRTALDFHHLSRIASVDCFWEERRNRVDCIYYLKVEHGREIQVCTCWMDQMVQMDFNYPLKWCTMNPDLVKWRRTVKTQYTVVPLAPTKSLSGFNKSSPEWKWYTSLRQFRGDNNCHTSALGILSVWEGASSTRRSLGVFHPKRKNPNRTPRRGLLVCCRFLVANYLTLSLVLMFAAEHETNCF